MSEGIPAADLGDDDLERELRHLHEKRHDILVDGTADQLRNHSARARELERAYLQRLTMQLHVQFIHAVAVGRKGKMSEADVARVADGRIFTGEEALALKLVDRLGNLDDAVNLAARLAGVRGRPGTIYPRRKKPTLIDLLSNTTDSESLIDRALSRRAGFLYRW